MLFLVEVSVHIIIKTTQTMFKSKFGEVNMANTRHRKTDDRTNNVERIRDIVKNTEEKIHEAEMSMEFVDPLQSKLLKEKNKRRKQSIEALNEEMKDEIAARKKGEV